MKVNFDFNLTDSYGEEITQPKIDEAGRPVTIDVMVDGELVKKIAKEPVNAISLIAASIVNPGFVTGDYIHHAELSDQVAKEKEFDISKSDFDLIKKSIDCKANSLPPKAKGYILLKFREIDINNALPIPPETKTKTKSETKK